MKKSTPFNFDKSEINKSDELVLNEKLLPRTPKKKTIENILAFSKAYSVRNCRSMGKIDFVLN